MPVIPPPLQAHAAILEGLKILAALDPDKARLRNGEGFSAADSRRGRALAGQSVFSDDEAIEGLYLLARYQRQIPARVLRAARWTPPPVRTSLSDALDAIIAMRPRSA